MSVKELAILGSTGSIGTQTLDICRRYPERFHPYAISGNNNVDLLIEQAREFQPEIVCVANESHYDRLREGIGDLPVKVFAGKNALNDMVTAPHVDVVVAAMVGYAGLEPTISAIKSNKTIALANKETLVVAGELITRLVEEHQVAFLPIDSEHSAIFQCLRGEKTSEVDKLLLTASGGPFLHMTMEQLNAVSVDDALRHPNWNMGAKITIDSATMMNKGFEIIEAKWLFGIPVDRIEVVVHPQSIIHSAVAFKDGSVKAQLGVPDMRIPIQYALTYPERMESPCGAPDLFAISALTFERADTKKFRCLELAKQAIWQGGSAPCVLNAANEVANFAFRNKEINFQGIPYVIERALNEIELSLPTELEHYVEVHNRATKLAQDIVRNYVASR
ncbi:MAG: 1-deoxy-D-xylulose-5-phosphate reductoisomerase [Paludibacteraceae bacterium]|nr:1-deoxy-D-xylulose-5-phosphate reductoisomerase [Paludibacteraceae bacterium]